MVLESGLLQERAGRYELTGPCPAGDPTTLHDSLMAPLDRLAAVKPWPNSGDAGGASFRCAATRRFPLGRGELATWAAPVVSEAEFVVSSRVCRHRRPTSSSMP